MEIGMSGKRIRQTPVEYAMRSKSAIDLQMSWAWRLMRELQCFELSAKQMILKNRSLCLEIK